MINRAITNRHPMKKTSPGCAVIVFAKFVRISGATWLAAPLSSAKGCIGIGVDVVLALHSPTDVGAEVGTTPAISLPFMVSTIPKGVDVMAGTPEMAGGGREYDSLFLRPSPRLKSGDSRVHITSLWLSSSLIRITASTASVIVASGLTGDPLSLRPTP
ncbi:MAG TPA: hypothetical protein VKL21_10795, partial [Candidatus Methanoperedens sp.]|nr:hypothetical protein [Candidatus Methanoperedens sp.]